ncbi:MAG: cobalamin biosynthesis protein CobD [Anaerolineaceae bacterium]|nr:cobalamin biosynthesis protein CobD [Anaerolineaceae bacterium]
MFMPILPLFLGFVIDLFFGDPHEIPHPVVWIGKLISFLEIKLRKVFPKTAKGERTAGFILWVITVTVSTGIPWLVLYFCGKVSVYLRIIIESIICWQIIAVRDLKTESMKVYDALSKGSLPEAKKAVSMIVGRDTEKLDETGIIKAAVETIAENTSDGIAAPLFYIALFGTPAGFFYKAVNTMDSMLGYVDPPYTNFGWFPAKADDVFNFIPSRIAAILMLIAGGLQKLDLRNGWKIFVRDRYKHASPNSAQTESACAGLLRVQLAGDAYYHGVLHKKQFIGDPLRNVEREDIPRTCRLMYLTSVLLLMLSCFIRMVLR